jgi:hypothetical protein
VSTKKAGRRRDSGRKWVDGGCSGRRRRAIFFLVVVGGLLRKDKRMVVCRGR